MYQTIKATKIQLGDLLDDSNFFTVPEFQREYVWDKDNVNQLLDDLWEAYQESDNMEYFVGSLVLVEKNPNSKEYEILDGQQRLTTFILLLATIKEMENSLKEYIQECLFSKGNKLRGIPQRDRLTYKIRGKANSFLRNYIQYGTIERNIKNVSVNNFINTIETIKKFLRNRKADLEKFTTFLFQKVIFVQIVTGNIEEGFKIFNTLNNRGIPLSTADILKAENIGVITEQEGEKAEEYAKEWEEIEDLWEGDIERLLGYIRTILIKEKARKGLLNEFKEKIYSKGLLSKGKETLEIVKEYNEYYQKLINYTVNESIIRTNRHEDIIYKNLIEIMKIGLPSKEWISALLYFYKKFNEDNLLNFLIKLEFKVSNDWVLYVTPTKRINNINNILKTIEKAKSGKTVVSNSEIFQVDTKRLRETLLDNVYGKRFVKYLLLKYNFLKRDCSNVISNYGKFISVEHILPQNPSKNSQWRKWFTDEEIARYKHRLGNLVLLNRIKNIKLSNKDFEEKKRRYFEGSRGTYIITDEIFRKGEWKKEDIEKRSREIVEKLVRISYPDCK